MKGQKPPLSFSGNIIEYQLWLLCTASSSGLIPWGYRT